MPGHDDDLSGWWSTAGAPPDLPAGPPEAQASKPHSPSESSGGDLRRYEELALIGAGGMGEVRRVRDRLLDTEVALKFLGLALVGHRQARARFLAEATLTAQLHHPGIVPVLDRGELPDGRLWYTMAEVHGQTLTHHIEALRPAEKGTPPDAPALRTLVDHLRRAAEAMAYAHSQGVIHRDLKPENIMVGRFGEVFVMDWGLARRLGSEDVLGAEAESGAAASSPSSLSGAGTRVGDVLGTLAFMPPEQARGELDALGPQADVYALGAILHLMLTGEPVLGQGADPWRALREERLAIFEDVDLDELDDALVGVAQEALSPKPGDRPASAADLVTQLAGWLDGSARRARARAIVEGASALPPEIAELRAVAGEKRAAAVALLGSLPGHASDDRKAPAWVQEDQATLLEHRAALVELDLQQRVGAALSVDPDLPEAHELLADHHAERLLDSEARKDMGAITRHEVLLQAHDQGRHARLLSGVGALSLVTAPSGAEVRLFELVEKRRRLVPEARGILGHTPLIEHPLARGNYLLELHLEGHEVVKYPVFLGRGEAWEGVRPGSSEPHAIQLPKRGELAEDDCYVPAGWFWSGGDEQAMEPLPRRRLWCDGLVVKRFPVTHGEYLQFIQARVDASASPVELAALLPRLQEGDTERALYLLGSAGRVSLDRDLEGRPIHPDWPVTRNDWWGAVAFARWLATQTGKPWRLPNELEWEKAARGVDGRWTVWGHHVEPTWANVLGHSTESPRLFPVDSFPADESIYGVRGLTGNVNDRCVNVWTPEGPPTREGRVLRVEADREHPYFRASRGTFFMHSTAKCRLATRLADKPEHRWRAVGFRLVRSLTPEPQLE